jgi:hypothetical protein
VENIRDKWYTLSGEDVDVGFSEETFTSEKETAYNNIAIAYNLKGRRGLPRDVDVQMMLDVYLGCCSIEMCTEALSVAAATFANGGVCPITGKEVFPADIVRYVLSQTFTCGMYDQSGQMAVEVGAPSKSGVSGVLMVIVPNMFGFATFSPRLNAVGNSIRGIEFSKRLVQSYRVHMFESLRAGNTGAKVDPRTNGVIIEKENTSRLAWALNVGDVWATTLSYIYLFAVVQAAMSSRLGLSDAHLRCIQDTYKVTYEEPLSDTLLKHIVNAIGTSPEDITMLEGMSKQLQIPDFMKTIIMMALIDGAMVDGKFDSREMDVILRVCVVLGIDRNVVLMEFNRCQKHAGHRFKNTDGLDISAGRESFVLSRKNSFLSGTDKEQIFGSRQIILDRAHVTSEKSKAKGAKKQGIRDATKSEFGCAGSNCGDTTGDDVVALRREILRLRRKVHTLSHMVHDTRVGGHSPAVLDAPGYADCRIVLPCQEEDEAAEDCVKCQLM